MNFIKNIFIVIYIILFFNPFLAAQQNNGVYKYPIKPGSSEWKSFTTHDQMLKACQIPKEILEKMSTADLIETCLEYPLYGDILAYDKWQQGFKSVTYGFNGLQVLLLRKNAGNVLLEKYKGMNPQTINQNLTIIEKGDYGRKIFSLEILFAQNDILKNLSLNEKRELLNECIIKARVKKQFPEIYGIQSFRSIGLIIGRILTQVNFKPLIEDIQKNNEMKIYIEEGTIPELHDFQTLISYTIQYLGKD